MKDKERSRANQPGVLVFGLKPWIFGLLCP